MKVGDRVFKIFLERFFECEVVQLDKEDGEGNEISLVLLNKRIFLVVGSVDEGIDFIDYLINILVKWLQL